jgi:TonB family protein
MDATLLSDVLAFSAQVACVVAVGSLLPLLVRIDAAGVRYAYWRVLLALCLALPWLQSRQSVSPVIEAVATAAIAPAAVLPMVQGGAPPVPAFEWAPFIGWILVAGIALRLSRFGLGLWRLRRLRALGRRAPASEEHEELQWRVGARAEIRYVEAGQPVTFGVWRPIVLLPEILRSQPSEIERVVLCHELLHVRRRDWAWVIAEEAVRAALWFHPGIWWLISRVRMTREEVVDELTVLATGQRRTYIEALLLFADAAPVSPAPAFARRRHLFTRMLLISKEAVMSSRQVLLSCAVMVATVVVGSWYAVATFPLTQVVAAQGRIGGPPSATGNEPGPLELRAKPITPENPIPRRTFSVTPQNPGDGTSDMVAVGLRLVIDEQGRVAEVRNVGGGIGGRGFVQGFSTAGGTVRLNVDGDRALVLERTRQQGIEPPSASFVKAAMDAVRQWQYDPPADGPLAFDVTFAFVAGSEPRLIAHGGSLPFIGAMTGRIAPPPPPASPPPAGAIRVGGIIMQPTKVRHVEPPYPPIAQSARVQGVVIIEIVIEPDGRVGTARVLRSIPLLDQAALDAVKQWEFTPTRLNGNPVPVVMTTTVQFILPPQ